MAESAPQSVLVTGGAGFIGSHTVVELLQAGHAVTIVDDLSNASPKVLDRIARIVGPEASARCTFHEVDITDEAALDAVFVEAEAKAAARARGGDESRPPFDAVIHFAGFKAVGESVQKPLEYYSNNLGGTLSLCRVMRAHDVCSIVFSSSSTVYGDPDEVPLTELSPKKMATNPYGWTKWMIEQILTDLAAADERWDVVLLRYFNPIGAHPSGLIGEDPKGIPNNLVPYVAQTAVGRRDAVHVFGDDYPTPDGTGIRDYIHVVDLARGHVAALEWMVGRHGVEIFNLGTGTGSSVLEVIRAFSEASGVDVPYVIEGRRAGDIARNFADASKAERELGWKAEFTLADMCRDSWNWQSKNPEGFE